MKISTSLYFDQSVQQMSTVQGDLAATQEQLSTGKKIVKPSDSPDQASMVTRFNTELARQTNYQSTLTQVETRLKSEETAMTSASDVLSTIKTLALQAANGTLATADRQAIALQLGSLRDQLLSLANAQDSNGNYLFSGTRVGQPAFGADASGQTVYQGDQGRMQVPVGDNRRMNLNMVGSDAFTSVVRDDGKGGKTAVGFFQSLDDLVSAVKNNDPTNTQRGISEVDNLSQGASLATAQIGSDLHVVDMQNSVLDSLVLNLKTVKSNVEDVDYTTAVTKMNKDQLALEAAQSSFAKISQMSLFKFLG
jgi:flagellar hook-associated protein 3 FlgL